MKQIVTLSIVVFLFTAFSPTLKAQVNTQDSLALVDFYDSTNGANWKNNANWLTSAPLSTWNGIVLDSNGRVSQINLYINNLTGTLPNSIGNLTELTSISLHINTVGGNIPASIGKLTKLTSLDLGENRFTGTIPDSLASLTNLTQLDLSDNQLTGSIPTWIGNLTNLQDLWLHYNNLSDSIPSSIGNLTALQYLVLQNNQLSGPIPASFGNLNNLQGLFLQNNKFTFDGMELIATKFPSAQYAPQAPIPLLHPTNTFGNVDYGSLFVSVGGTPANDTFHWSESYNNRSIVSVADSILNTTYLNWYSGMYSVTVTNAIANKLTLYSDTISIILEPIKAINLQAKQTNRQVLLQSQTIVEQNTESFTIQHSTDGSTFEDINTEEAVGYGNNNYSIVDKSPAEGVNYYRIEAIDKDGAITYSRVVQLTFKNNRLLFTVYPNPSRENVTVVGNHIASIQVIDNTGRILSEQQLLDATNPSLSVNRLAAGVYYLHIKTTDGSNEMLKFVKK